MPLSTKIAAQSHLAAYGKDSCPQCGGWLLAPTRSEHLNERHVRHTWWCEACGCEFETAVFFTAAA